MGTWKKTKFPNVEAYESDKRKHNGKPDRCFYIRYVHQGKRIRENVAPN